MGCTESSAYDVNSKPLLTPKGNSCWQANITKSSLETQGSLSMDQKKKHNLSESEILDMFDKSQGNFQKFFHLISERVTQFYDQLSNEILELLNDHKVSYNDSKVVISEQVLIMALDILEVVGRRINFDFNFQTFHFFNKAQRKLLAYLKMKYPRAGNVFVSSDLSQKFKSFDYVEDPKNDILARFNVYFTSNSEANIVKKIKIFFNAIMQELDDKFPIFKNLMEDQVFKYEEGEGAHKKAKILNYKIGRKIPENTSKFIVDDSEELTINSPEIFRTIVKWVEDLQDWFEDLQGEINSRDTFKVYKTTKTGNIHETIFKDEIDELSQILKKKIKSEIGMYKDHLKALRKEMDIFNINLLKILFTTERKQKYVPLREAKIIKYAMLNTKFVSWMLSEMLVFMLRKLIEVGQDMEATKVRRKMDLIKFTVTDLMRAQVVGNKKEIMSVYNNIERLQKSNEINIIKIKNRLGTSLNDAMIIFTIKQSKLICELQLILSEGGSEVEKLKNIEFLNHMLYELERSPYGVLSQIAVILGYKDNKINFESKIRFQNNQYVDFEKCKKHHSVVVEKIQKKPFLCIKCTQFYLPLENIFDYSYCEQCNTFQCCKCAFALNSKLEKDQIHKRFTNQLEAQLFTVKIKPKIPKEITLDKIVRRIYPQKVFFKNIFPRKAYFQIKPKDLVNFLKNKQYIQATGNEELVKLQHIYFLLVQFRGSETNIMLYYWNRSQQEIQNCFNPAEVFYDLSKISTSYYDFITFIKATEVQKLQVAAAGKTIRLCLKSEDLVKNIKQYRYISLSCKFDVILVLKLEVSKASSNIDGIEVSQKLLAQKKDFVQESLGDVRKTLPDIESVRENFYMKNVGVTTAHLDYFKNCDERLKIKSVNLSDNKIANISALLESCERIEVLIVSENFIKEIRIKKNLPNLTKIIAYSNFITVVEGLEFVPEIQNLNFENNKLKVLNSMSLPKLKELNISNNKMNSLMWIQQSNLPELQILSLRNSGISFYAVYTNLDFSFKFPKLEELNFAQNMANKLTVVSSKLIFLDCCKCSIKNLSITSKKIEVLKLQQNQIENLQQILANRLPELKQILCNNAGTITVLPELDDVETLIIDLSKCNLTDVSNLAKSGLLNIKQLILDGNQNIKMLPSLKFQTLTKLSIKDVHLNDLSFVESSTLPLLDELEITGEAISGTENYLLECPTFKLPKLKKLKLYSFSFSDMSKFALSEFAALEELAFEELNSKNFPVLKLNHLKYLIFKECKIEDVAGLHQSEFRSLETLDISNLNEEPDDQNETDGLIFKEERRLKQIKAEKLTKLEVKSSPGINLETLFMYKPALEYFNATDNKLKTFPVMQLKNVKTLDFSDCQVEDITNLTQCKFQSLEKLIFTNNEIKVLPKISINKLKHLTFENNKISNLKQFQASSLPALEFINFSSNQLKYFPIFKFENLRELQIGNNPIQSFSSLSRCELKSLQTLILKDCKFLRDKVFPTVNLPECKSIKIIECNLDDIQNLMSSQLPQLRYLQIININIDELPILNLPMIKTIKIEVRKQNINQENSAIKSENRLSNISKMGQWKCPKLQSIFIQNCIAKILPALTFQSLQTIDLQGSDIQDLTQFKMSNVPFLTQINLSNNKSLSTMAFPNSIDHITFNGCNFSKVQSQCLEDVPCKVIEMSKNKIEEISHINTTQLEILNLQSNLLTDISSIFKESPLKLKNISLKSNKIKAIPELTFPQLNYLHISDNEITSLRIKKKNFPALIGLYAEQNQITAVETLDIGTLTSVNLNRNRLEEVTFFRREYVETSEMRLANIRLENNKIRSIAYLPNVSSVHLKGNQLVNLDWLENCETDFIATLNVSNNRIKSVSGLENANQPNKIRFNLLSQLDLSQNNIKQFQVKNVRFPSLTTFNLSKNQLIKFPQLRQSSFPNLLKLNLSQNSIPCLPQQYKLSKIGILDLSSNKLTHLNTKQLILKDLLQLYLTNNQLKQLSGIQNIRSTRLQKLDLSMNVLSKLPKMTKFVALSQLHVDNNEISEFEQFLHSNINDWSNLKFVYQIKVTLEDKRKEDIFRKIYKKIGGSQCRNKEFNLDAISRLSKESKKDKNKENQKENNLKGKHKDINLAFLNKGQDILNKLVSLQTKNS